MSGHYTIHFDRTGFPLIANSSWPFYISLFPVSKFQFERFLVDTGNMQGRYTDDWYRDITAANPRCGWQNGREKPWQLMLTGAPLEPAMQDFIAYLGDGYRLSEEHEWLALHHSAHEISALGRQLLAWVEKSSRAASPVSLWIRQNLCPMTDAGILERLSGVGGGKCIGRPHPTWQGNNWDPEIVRPVSGNTTLRKFAGFRVVVPQPAARRTADGDGHGHPDPTGW